jgi:hypothetical protein
MGLWDDFVSGVSGFFDSAGQPAADQGNWLGDIGSYATDIFSAAPTYDPTAYGAQAMNVGSPYSQYIAPYVGGAVAGGGMLARIGSRFASKYPQLAGSLAAFRAAGKNVTRGQLWSLLKRFGPDFLIAGGILSAGAISELMMAGPGRRRMNPGNVKALRRAHRRMKSFHHICATNDTLLRGRKRRSSPANFGGTRITQVK